jgi:hypothetical protein
MYLVTLRLSDQSRIVVRSMSSTIVGLRTPADATGATG